MVGSFIRAFTPLEWPLRDMDDFFFSSQPLLYEVDVFVALPCDGCCPYCRSNRFPTHGFYKKNNGVASAIKAV